ncbi:MAG: hypothetical protein M3Q30_04795 [Actinomycetota bacterium]|nr:hypothetical protein [Actinomycetota bacterium]
MTACPACGQNVRPIWPTCRSCGALLMARPVPFAAEGATVPAAAPSAAEQFFAPAVLQPTARLLPAAPAYTNPPSTASSGASARGAGKWLALIGMVVVAAVATLWFTFRPGTGVQHRAPVALAPRAPTAGLPTSLEAVVRIGAESTRRNALQTVEQVGNGDVASLANMQPNYKWFDGNERSTDAHVVSVAQDGGVVTIAVAASNHDVCAFGQWWPGARPQYVTMAHEPSCAAANAPRTGWSSEAGGAASDLPDDNG